MHILCAENIGEAMCGAVGLLCGLNIIRRAFAYSSIIAFAGEKYAFTRFSLFGEK